MSFQVYGASSATMPEVDGTNWRALRVTDRPIEFGSGGSYAMAWSAVSTAAPAAGVVWAAFRWTNVFLDCVIRNIRLDMQVNTASTAAAPACGVYVVRNYVVNPTTGSAIANVGQGRKRTTFPVSQYGDLRAAGTSLTGQTRTVDPLPIVICNTPIALGSKATDAWTMDGPGDHPIVLRANEGIEVQNITGGATTCVYQYTLRMAWKELPGF